MIDSGMPQSVGPEFFEAIFARDLDPWGFETSEYERAKYADTLHHLPRARYHCGLEIGCATGVLSGLLADRCQQFLGVDFSEIALAEARRKHAARDRLAFARLHFPLEAPAGRYDLIVLSEVLYFMTSTDVAATAAVVSRLAEPGATLMLVHWLGQSKDHVLSGDEAVETFVAAATDFAAVTARVIREGYRLDVLATGEPRP